MKTIISAVILLSCFLATQLTAQNSIHPIDAKVVHDDEQRECIQVNLDPEPKTLKKAWKDYLKDKYDVKLKGIGFWSNKDLLSAEEVVVKQISTKQIDFYTLIVEDDNGSEMKVYVRYGYDIFLSKYDNSNDYRALSEMLEGFLKDYLPKYHNGRIDDTEERIEKLSDETADLQEDIADDASKIIKLKEEIVELEEELVSNKQLLDASNKKLLKRREKMTRINKQLKKL